MGLIYPSSNLNVAAEKVRIKFEFLFIYHTYDVATISSVNKMIVLLNISNCCFFNSCLLSHTDNLCMTQVDKQVYYNQIK